MTSYPNSSPSSSLLQVATLPSPSTEFLMPSPCCSIKCFDRDKLSPQMRRRTLIVRWIKPSASYAPQNPSTPPSTLSSPSTPPHKILAVFYLVFPNTHIL
eukprot:GILI01016805.1.p2 GENE.GILI01016805.1~~GILI01016805.1.p2  ORF type:complete len:100 (+),score=11.56 GILI01016805.1:78-377(+)